MKITVGNIWVFLEAYDIKYIVPVCDLPCIYVFGVFVPVVPEKKGVPAVISVER